ncbi:hypothetical protein [Sandaracinus amylolyticus]|uniref:hypothetical protein n=1 Tax=Sandaracinus amylolyticus TaxID=927083 RepID=UPI001F3305B4|nr:hypothetical protein [Sandaracinus amylolyticus]UJR79674.1 Hypothetical protein I5071_17120 [Sandaracinus amylolyticus]
MRTESHISITRTTVREGEISRHAGTRFEGGRAYAVATGLGLPRSWPMATSAILVGFERGLEETRTKQGPPPAGLTGAGRALHCAERARASLADLCEQLVERSLPDASFVALLVEHGDLHVVSAGPTRAYLHRRGKPQRLTPREEPAGGVLRSAVSHCHVVLEPGDLLMMGSVSAFSMRAISQVVSVLQADPRTAPAVIASVLTDPAGQAGVGAGAVVMRVE